MDGFFKEMGRFVPRKGRREKYMPNPFIFENENLNTKFSKPKGRKIKKAETVQGITRKNSSQKRGETTNDTPCDNDTIDSGSIHIKGHLTPKSIHFPISRSLSPESLNEAASSLQKREPEIIRKSPIVEKTESAQNSISIKTHCEILPISTVPLKFSVEKWHQSSNRSSRQGLDEESMRDFTPIKAYEPSDSQGNCDVGELFDGIHRNLIPKLRSHAEARNMLESNYSTPMCYQNLLDCFHNIELALFTLIDRKERLTYIRIRDWIFSQYRV